MKNLSFLLLIPSLAFQAKAQFADCMFKPPVVTINFGSGNIANANTDQLVYYDRVSSSCPTDGYYAYTSYTGDCFRGDWHTISHDHTSTNASGNMMLVNAANSGSTFFSKKINGLKSGTTYEFAVWMMNLCKISEKCPFPLLPRITIQIEAPNGKMAAEFHTGELARSTVPRWTRYQALFTTPASLTSLTLTMIDESPGGCGNDFALDDITFRECVKPAPIVKTTTKAPTVVKKQRAAPKQGFKKPTPLPAKKQPDFLLVKRDSIKPAATVSKQRSLGLPAPPLVLKTRANPLVKEIETEAGEIRLDLYDNGEIDGDTVTIYHNNSLLMSHAKLSNKPISFRIPVDVDHPHHELVMVADNLGSIPPNTSVMVVTSGAKRYEVFISSNEKKNAKVVFNLKE